MNEPVKDTAKLPKAVKASASKPTGYNVLVGFNFGCKTPDDEGTRVEPGPLTVDLPPSVLSDLIDAGAIVEGKDDAS